MNAKVKCKPRNMTNFNQKVKTLSLRYDTETNLVKIILEHIFKKFKSTSIKKLLKSIVPRGII